MPTNPTKPNTARHTAAGAPQGAEAADSPRLGNLVPQSSDQQALTRTNFIYMAVCGLLIIVGFCLMAGGATTTDSFNPEIFSVRRIVVGPAISFAGFVLMAFAILLKKRQPSR